MKSYIEVRHNIEVAHRLFVNLGKCEQIHGHSMWVTLRIDGEMNELGMLVNSYDKPLEFGEVKHGFRNFLDTKYDHHLLLNKADPWSRQLVFGKDVGAAVVEPLFLPGLHATDGDPTTENIAKWIADWAVKHYAIPTVSVHVAETSVNSAGVVLGGE
jgi:6-pyruvoyl-tetrahydropterin synthase